MAVMAFGALGGALPGLGGCRVGGVGVSEWAARPRPWARFRVARPVRRAARSSVRVSFFPDSTFIYLATQIPTSTIISNPPEPQVKSLFSSPVPPFDISNSLPLSNEQTNRLKFHIVHVFLYEPVDVEDYPRLL
uniref:Putative secreted protein n=1 Tax=Ixodes ricinus TaxID=34613 RepID=A0A6B0URZ0_IXORI